MRLRTISKTKACGVFGDLEWPTGLLPFSRYNLIFGWNGTGKTTLSSMLRALERDVPFEVGSAVLEFDSGTVEISPRETPGKFDGIRVFNRDFVAENVFAEDGPVAPIVFLGEASVSAQREIEVVRASQVELRREQKRLSGQLRDAEEELDRFCRDKAREIKAVLRWPGSNRKNPYNDYNKGDFRGQMERLSSAGAFEAVRLSEEEDASLAQRVATPPMEPVDDKGLTLADITGQLRVVSDLVARDITASSIEELEQDPRLAHWTQEGLEIHREREAAVCLFCGGVIGQDRIEHLNAHFNEQFQDLMEQLENAKVEIEAELDRVESFSPLHPNQLLPELRDEYSRQVKRVSDIKDRAGEHYRQLLDAIAAKKKTPFRAIELDHQFAPLDQVPFDALARMAASHNEFNEGFAEKQRLARERLEAGRCAAASESYIALRNRIENLQRENNDTNDQLVAADERVDELENTQKDARRPVAELNEDVAGYLGHGELSFANEGSGYAIQRNGKSASRLSEGERTALALLYFLQSLRDRDFDLSSGVVVVDDPVSSLDSNALFHAFGFVKSRTAEAGQLLILTHNFAFFRQVRGWLGRLPGQRKPDATKHPAQFYMLDASFVGDRRRSVLRQLDPLLLDYDSEYHYLFARVYRVMERGAAAGSLDQYYDVPNNARRLLEAFLAFRWPRDPHHLERQLDRVEFDTAKKSRILRFLHTNSHKDHLDDPEHDPSTLAEAPAILRDLFDLMRSQDENHVAEMLKLIAGRREEPETGSKDT